MLVSYLAPHVDFVLLLSAKEAAQVSRELAQEHGSLSWRQLGRLRFTGRPGLVALGLIQLQGRKRWGLL